VRTCSPLKAIQHDNNIKVLAMLDEVLVNESISWAMNKSNWSSPMYEDDDEDGYIEYRDRPETYVVPILFSLIFLVGVLGNGSLIYVLCRHKSMRSVPNTFIFNLALGDLLILIFTVPFTSTVYTLDSWPFGEFVCKASEFAKVKRLKIYPAAVINELCGLVKRFFRCLSFIVGDVVPVFDHLEKSLTGFVVPPGVFAGQHGDTIT
jgi:hypothetical protein